MKRRREKERREEERKKKRRRREEEKFKEKRKAKVWICNEFWYGFLYRYLFGGFEYVFFWVESMFGMVVWFGCGPQWRKILYRENVGF